MNRLTILALLAPFTMLHALPTGPEVIHGTAKFDSTTQSMTITASDKAVVHWKNFSIAENELARIQLPNKKSIVLNRVLSSTASEIFGKLESNGKVLLINPNGVLFGKNASVNVAALVASTLDVNTDDFLNNKELVFAGDSTQSIHNEGAIHTTSGDLIFVGRTVENSGSLTSDEGQVALLAVSQASLTPQNDGFFYIRTKLEGPIDNPYALAFKHPQQETDAPARATNSGTIIARSSEEQGGKVKIFGDQILIEEGLIETSERLGGGQILIGGEYQGNSEDFHLANYTHMGPSTKIAASALEKGNGGEVIVWGEKRLISNGELFANGGQTSGDGGLVEISGHGYYQMGAHVNTLAPQGKTGTFLMDPSTVVISTTGPSSGITYSVIPCPSTPATLGPVVNILNTDLNTQLGLNCVIIDASTAGVGGTITVDYGANVDWSHPTNSLTLIAGGDIKFHASVRSHGTALASGDLTVLSHDGNIFVNSQAYHPDINGEQRVSVGSKFGTTTVTASGTTPPSSCSCSITDTSPPCSGCGPALNTPYCCNFCNASADTSSGTGNICIQGVNATFPNTGPTNETSPGLAQIGYTPRTLADPDTITGPIIVSCNNLNIQLGVTSGPGHSFHSSPAIIGHNSLNQFSPIVHVSNIDAPISVTARGTIHLSALPGDNAASQIGHSFFENSSLTTFIDGSITVAAGLDIILQTTAASVPGALCCIGHGNRFAGALDNSHADITVSAVRDIIIDASGQTVAGNCDIGIGNNFTSSGSKEFGDIHVFAGRDLFMMGQTHGASTVFTNQCCYIGHCDQTDDGTSITSNIQVQACRDIFMNPQRADKFGIGAQTHLTGAMTGNVSVLAGRNLTIKPTETLVGPIFDNVPTTIGYAPGTLISPPGGFSGPTYSNTFVAVGGDILIDVSSGFRSAGIGAQGSAGTSGAADYGNVFVSAGGNITLIAGSGVSAFIGTDGNISRPALVRVGPNMTHIYSGGNITATNAASGGKALLGISPSISSFSDYSLDVRAAGDIQLANSFTPTGAATIYIEADTNLPTGGELWTVSSGILTSIAGGSLTMGSLPPPPPLNIFTPATCPCSCATGGSPTETFVSFTSSSAPIGADGRGGISVNPAPNAFPISLTTHDGNLTLHSASAFTSGATASLSFGPNPSDQIDLGTINGNLEIWGSIINDALYNITLDQALTTTGSVKIIAGHNLHMNGSSSIDTSGGNQPITLAVDNLFPFSPAIGPGAFVMDAGSSVLTGTGLLSIYTSEQGFNTILGTLNGAAFIPGTLFINTPLEIWCTYFQSPPGTQTPPGTPTLVPGIPFTITYKNCLATVTQASNVLVSQFLVDLHPYNEYLGWIESFTEENCVPGLDQFLVSAFNDPYYLRRRHIKAINKPKTWTWYVNQSDYAGKW